MTPMLRRFCVWALSRAVEGSWSPSLAALGLRPTLRWAWSGRHADLDGHSVADGWREGVEEGRRT
jgi:hypothetical protein